MGFGTGGGAPSSGGSDGGAGVNERGVPPSGGSGGRAWWRLSSEYEGQLGRFTRGDAGLAIAVVVASVAATVAQGLWFAAQPDYPHIDVRIRVGLAELTVLLLLVGMLAAARRQDARSFGFSRTHLGRSLLVGVVLAAVFLGVARAIGMASGTAPDVDAYMLSRAIPYYLIVIGFTEELVWRGWATPRLEATFGRRWVGVVLAGILFGLMHLPFTYILNPLPLGEFLGTYWWRMVIPFAWHFPLWWLYGRFNSLAAPTLLHLAMNLSGEIM